MSNTGDFEGAQQGALLGGTASAFYGVVVGIPVNYWGEKRRKAATPQAYVRKVDKAFLFSEKAEQLSRWSSIPVGLLGGSMASSMYALYAGVANSFFEQNFSLAMAAEIGAIQFLCSYFVPSSRKSKLIVEGVNIDEVKEKIKATISPNAA